MMMVTLRRWRTARAAWIRWCIPYKRDLLLQDVSTSTQQNAVISDAVAALDREQQDLHKQLTAMLGRVTEMQAQVEVLTTGECGRGSKRVVER